MTDRIIEGDGDTTIHPDLSEAQASGEPVYPHTRWIKSLLEEQETRRLSKSEVTAITEAHMFENLVENAIPELRTMVAGIEPGIERDNATLYLAVAMEFASGMGNDLAAMREAKNIVQAALLRAQK